MARLRKGCAYRRLERPYTRRSKFRKLSFVRAVPTNKIVRYEAGNLSRDFPQFVDLISKDSLQIRHNSIESARLTTNRFLERNLGKHAYKFQIRIYPHHVLRENPLASGAGADRMSTGMKKSFGKPIGLAARVKKGQVILSVGVDKENIDAARKSLKRASYKMPCSCTIQVRET